MRLLVFPIQVLLLVQHQQQVDFIILINITDFFPIKIMVIVEEPQYFRITLFFLLLLIILMQIRLFIQPINNKISKPKPLKNKIIVLEQDKAFLIKVNKVLQQIPSPDINNN